MKNKFEVEYETGVFYPEIGKFPGGEYVLLDQQTEVQENQGELKVVFEDGKLYNEVSLAETRARLM